LAKTLYWDTDIGILGGVCDTNSDGNKA
jgi:hypothetical protein